MVQPSIWPKQKDCPTFYGNPDGNTDGLPDPKWEAENLVAIIPPYKMFWSWNKAQIRTMRVHKRCADAMQQALADIGRTFSPAELDYYDLRQCGGAYNFRPMRGGGLLSMHAYGCAIDLAPQLNPLGKRWQPNTRMMPKEAVDCFRKLGASWGGDFVSRPDAMHFQFASTK